MHELERVCVLEFDEMSDAQTVEFDKSDVIVGPHKNMQVFMARGLLYFQELSAKLERQIAEQAM